MELNISYLIISWTKFKYFYIIRKLLTSWFRIREIKTLENVPGSISRNPKHVNPSTLTVYELVFVTRTLPNSYYCFRNYFNHEESEIWHKIWRSFFKKNTSNIYRNIQCSLKFFVNSKNKCPNPKKLPNFNFWKKTRSKKKEISLCNMVWKQKIRFFGFKPDF